MNRVKGRKAEWGERMIRMEVHFHTKPTIAFNSLAELPRVIEKVLIQNDIRIHPTGAMKKYLIS